MYCSLQIVVDFSPQMESSAFHSASIIHHLVWLPVRGEPFSRARPPLYACAEMYIRGVALAYLQELYISLGNVLGPEFD